MLESLPITRVCVVFIVAFPDVTMYPEAAIPIWLDMLQP